MQQDNRSQRRLFISAYVLIAAIFLAINGYSFLAYDGFLYINPKHWTEAGSRFFTALVFFGLMFGVSLCGTFAISCIFKQSANNNLVFSRTYLTALCVIILCLFSVVIISYFVLDKFRNSADEFVYVFQALTILDGRVHVPTPPIPDSFSNALMIEKAGRWVGQYAPGWPVILAGAKLIRIPFWLVNPLFGALSAWLLYLLARHSENRAVAVATVIVFVTTPFFLFNSASYFSHASFASMAMIYALGVVRYRDAGRFGFLVLAGAGLGAAFTIRYYPAVLLFLPIFLLPGNLKQRLRLVFGIGVGAGPFVIAVFFYNYAAYGDPFSTGYTWHPEGAQTNLSVAPLAGLFFTAKRFYELSGWSGPLILFLYGFSLFYKIRKGEVNFIDYLFPVVLLGLFFFTTSGGNRYGPRYFFDVYPFLVLSMMSGLAAFIARNDGFWTRVINNALIVSVLYCLCIAPLIAVYFHAIVTGRQELYRMVNAKNLNNALVVVETWTGDRRRLHEQELIRNDPNLSASVLYARNVDIQEVSRLFPGREIWVYRRDGETEPAYLRKVHGGRSR